MNLGSISKADSAACQWTIQGIAKCQTTNLLKIRNPRTQALIRLVNVMWRKFSIIHTSSDAFNHADKSVLTMLDITYKVYTTKSFVSDSLSDTLGKIFTSRINLSYVPNKSQEFTF